MFNMSPEFEYNIKRIGYNHPLLGQWCSYQAATRWMIKFRTYTSGGFCYYLVKRKVWRGGSDE